MNFGLHVNSLNTVSLMITYTQLIEERKCNKEICNTSCHTINCWKNLLVNFIQNIFDILTLPSSSPFVLPSPSESASQSCFVHLRPAFANAFPKGFLFPPPNWLMCPTPVQSVFGLQGWGILSPFGSLFWKDEYPSTKNIGDIVETASTTYMREAILLYIWSSAQICTWNWRQIGQLNNNGDFHFNDSQRNETIT